MEHSNAFRAPHFYIVGAARSGTTAVWTWLQGHPDVFLPKVKEPGFFAFSGSPTIPLRGPYDPCYVSEIVTTAEEYRHLYEEGREKLRGDVSPVYMVNQSSAGMIARARPDARIVIQLRDPVARAFSQFLQHRREGLEPHSSFERALRDEPKRLCQGWSWGHGYVKNGTYAVQIARYLDAFERHQILFLTYERLTSDPNTCWDQLCRHLGLSGCPMPENKRVNATSNLKRLPAWPRLARGLRHPGPVQRAVKTCLPDFISKFVGRRLGGITAAKPELREQTRRSLVERFYREKAILRNMTGLSLREWRT